MRYLGRLGRSGGGVWLRKAMASEVWIFGMVTNGTYGDFIGKKADSTGTWWKGKKLVNTGAHHCPCLEMAMERDMHNGAFQRKNGCKNGDMNKWNMVISKGTMVGNMVEQWLG